eukprot:137112_1
MPKRGHKPNKKRKVSDQNASFPASSKQTYHLNHNKKQSKFETKMKSKMESQHQRHKHQSFLKRQNDVSLTPHQRIQELMRKSKKSKNKRHQKKKTQPKNTSNRKSNNQQTHSNTQLDGAQFRWMNEMLYNSTGNEAMNRIQEHKSEFIEYHQAYNDIVQNQWPQSPLQRIIRSITKKLTKISKANTTVKQRKYRVADFGCGDAKIARYFHTKYNKNKNIELTVEVNSFDFIALNEYVTACDICDVPLETESMDMVVFCLSLMGTNFHQYLIEAHRILKPKGLLKIAEVRSRFYGINKFEKFLNRTGFDVVAKDLDNTHFALFHCGKSAQKRCQTFPLNFDAKTILKPCSYKKR